MNQFIKDFLNYNYYRVAKFYFRREGSDAITAVIHICMIVFFSVALFFIFGLMFVYDIFNIQRGEKLWIVRSLVIVFCLCIYFIVSRRYKEKGLYTKFRDRWYGESKRLKFWRGIGVVLSALIPLLITILMVRNRDLIRDWIHVLRG